LDYTKNGNVLSANDSVNGNWSYTYDDFNRLLTAADGAQGQSFSYDAYGNRWQENVTLGTANSSKLTFDNSNRIASSVSGLTYDALGNVTNDGFHKYIYDAENRLIEVDDGGAVAAKYIYDAIGRRVSKTVGTVTTEYLFDLAGRVVAERDAATGVWNRSEIYAGGRHLATSTPFTTYFRHSDWLGSSRMKTLPNGEVAERCTNLPFGDGLSCTLTGAQYPPQVPYAGYEPDQETQLDHTWFRKYSSAAGRWTTPDPYLGSMDLANPQTLNRYTYVNNNPISLSDPMGLDHTQYFREGNCVYFYIVTVEDDGQGGTVVHPHIDDIHLLHCDPGDGTENPGSQGPSIGRRGSEEEARKSESQNGLWTIPLACAILRVSRFGGKEIVKEVAGKAGGFVAGAALGRQLAKQDPPTFWDWIGVGTVVLTDWELLPVGFVIGHDFEVFQSGGAKEWLPDGRAITRPTMLGEGAAKCVEGIAPGCEKTDSCPNLFMGRR